MADRKIDQIMCNKRILMYGIGNQFEECYKLFADKECLFFDGDPKKWGKTHNGNIINAPQEMPKCINNDSAVIITSIRNQYEIAKMLVETIGIPSSMIYMYTCRWYEDKIYNLDILQYNWDKIITYSQKFADAESCRYYLNSAMARRERNPLLLAPNPNCRENGEYGDIVCLKKKDSIIDCGAYTGDTVELYMKKLSGECKIYAIEPYEMSFRSLKKRIADNSWEDRVIAYNCAVGHKPAKTIIRYNANDFAMGISLSKTEGKEGQQVRVESLDNLFENTNISYIKFDIEGEEKKALRGAKKIIEKCHPRLMVSAYHKIEDFWELPEIIWSINENYKIYVGHAPGTSMEMEFYCIDADEEGL